MGLAIAVFVPEGMVVVSDGIAEIKNAKNDNGFLQKKQKTMFSFAGRYIVCVQGNGCWQGLPYAFYIEKIFHSMNHESFASTKEFADRFQQYLMNYINEYDNTLFYVAGIDEILGKSPIPVLCLVDIHNVIIINRGFNDCNVYNYHSIGHNLWINKLLLPTNYEINEREKITFENVDIDFSKYSIEEAIDFAKFMIRLTHQIDNFAQLKDLVGNSLYIGIVRLYDGGVKLITDL